MSNSVFDTDSFMHQEVDSAMETRLTPPAEGTYLALVETVEADRIVTKRGLQIILRTTYDILDEDLKEEMGMDKVVARQDLFLDIDNGVLQFGKNKNVRLGQLREAVNQNVDGEPWSPSMLVGAGPVNILVGHRYHKETGDGPFAEVRKVTKA